MENKVLILNGPNLNMLGVREPNHYGSLTLAQINELCEKQAARDKLELTLFQSNSESELVEAIQKALGKFSYIIINAAAFTHYSIAIRDALKAVQIPFIEVHLSNVDAREEFRKHSVLADIAVGRISGFGADSYLLALMAVKGMIEKNE